MKNKRGKNYPSGAGIDMLPTTQIFKFMFQQQTHEKTESTSFLSLLNLFSSAIKIAYSEYARTHLTHFAQLLQARAKKIDAILK